MSTLPLESSRTSHNYSESVLCLNNYYIHNPRHRSTPETNKEITMQTNTIYCGDCGHVLAYFPEHSVDLIYVDPPFFSNRHYEIIWGNGYELRAYEDRWKGGINNYVAWMEPKIRECYNVLKECGSFYLHCDTHANAYLRILLDKIFGEKCFQNEIVWAYRTGGASKNRFAGKHDTIFFYSKSEKWKFHPEKEKSYMMHEYGFKKSNFQKDEKGQYSWVYARDVWEIPSVGSATSERLGYPTQKPELLLEKIIKASSDPMDIILDPMCGCGTAISVAHRLGRRWIGIDVSPIACKVMMKRMQKLGVRIVEDDIINLPKSVEELEAMAPFEFQNWVIQKLYGRPSRKKVGDLGIDGWLANGEPVQIKQSNNIGRNIVDNFETAIRRQGKKTGMIIALSFGRGANEEVARAKQEEGLEIRLRTVKDLLKEI
jgi:DNA modification methylase